MWLVAPGCSVAPVGAPLLLVVAPGGSVAPLFMRFPRCPRLLLLVAASPSYPVVPLLRGLWVCGLLLRHVPLILRVLRCFRLLLPAVPSIRCSCGFPVAPGCGSGLFRCSRLFRCTCGCSVAPGFCSSIVPACWCPVAPG